MLEQFKMYILLMTVVPWLVQLVGHTHELWLH